MHSLLLGLIVHPLHSCPPECRKALGARLAGGQPESILLFHCQTLITTPDPLIILLINFLWLFNSLCKCAQMKDVLSRVRPCSVWMRNRQNFDKPLLFQNAYICLLAFPVYLIGFNKNRWKQKELELPVGYQHLGKKTLTWKLLSML